MSWLTENWALVVAVLFGISETLSLVPFFKSNGVFQLVYNSLKALAGKKDA